MYYVGFTKTYVDVIKSYVGVIKSYLGTLSPTMSRSLGVHSVHFSEHWAVTQKRHIIERNGRKFGPPGCNSCWYF